MVEYRPVVGFPAYEVGDDGSVWSNKSGVRKEMTKMNTAAGYKQVGLWNGPKESRQYVHRLVLMAFAGPPPKDGMQACHNNGDRSDCRLANLRWDTVKGNIADKQVHGTQIKGANHYCASLDDSMVAEARAKYLRKEGTINQLAMEYGVSFSTMHSALSGKTWKHVA